MDFNVFLFHGMAADSLRNLPPRHLTPMPAQQIVAWTPTRIIAAVAGWLMKAAVMPAAAETDA